MRIFLLECSMRRRTSVRLVAILFIGFFLALVCVNVSVAQNHEQAYFLLKDSSTYRITLSVTSSLYDYYQGKSHVLTLNNFASFVTPYAMALVGTDIRSIFPREEEFVNAVLMLVHQIPYQIVDDGKYPAETIVDNYGDCDVLSYVAASLMKSQDMNVVLLYYEQQSHMNIGVSLPSSPENSRTTVTYVDYRGVRYYMAECTGTDWRDGWRVGECPSELEEAQVAVITLENCEQIAPGQVSSSFGSMESTTISLHVSPSFVIEGNTISLSGQISVPSPNGTVALYAATNGRWYSLGTVGIDSNGRYTFAWTPTVWWQCYVKASWSGDSEHAGADSTTIPVYIIPRFLVFVSGGMIVIAVVAALVLLMRKTTQPEEGHPYEPTFQQFSI